MTTPDQILAALGGNITAARKCIVEWKSALAGNYATAIADLALRALDAMESAEAVMRPFSDEDHRRLAHDIAMKRPAGGEKLRRLRADLKSCIPAIQALHDKFLPGGIFAGNKDAAMRMVEEMTRVNQICGIIEMIDRLLSEPAPASDGRTGFCAECERLAKALDTANRDAKNAADLMLVANNEAVRYMRERDAAREQLQAVTAERDKLQAMKEAEWEAAKHRYCDLPVSENALDTATAFVRRWFGQPNKDEATDARELARMFDAVAADAVRNCKETNQ